MEGCQDWPWGHSHQHYSCCIHTFQRSLDPTCSWGRVGCMKVQTALVHTHSTQTVGGTDHSDRAGGMAGHSPPQSILDEEEDQRNEANAWRERKMKHRPAGQPFWQRFPSRPGGQWQVPVTWSQVAPFSQSQMLLQPWPKVPWKDEGAGGWQLQGESAGKLTCGQVWLQIRPIHPGVHSHPSWSSAQEAPFSHEPQVNMQSGPNIPGRQAASNQR